MLKKSGMELKPCPKCGGNSVDIHTEPWIGSKRIWVIICKDCKYHKEYSRSDFNLEEIIDIWNGKEVKK